MATEDSQFNNEVSGNGQSYYQPPSNYSPNVSSTQNSWQTNQAPNFTWPDTDGSNNAVQGYTISPVPPTGLPYTPIYTSQTELYRQATKRADAKLHFYQHLRSYIIVNVILWGIAIITGFDSGNFWSFTWPIWVTIFWGVGLVAEYVNVFGINDQRRQSLIEEEMRRMRR